MSRPGTHPWCFLCCVYFWSLGESCFDCGVAIGYTKDPALDSTEANFSIINLGCWCSFLITNVLPWFDSIFSSIDF